MLPAKTFLTSHATQLHIKCFVFMFLKLDFLGSSMFWYFQHKCVPNKNIKNYVFVERVFNT